MLDIEKNRCNGYNIKNRYKTRSPRSLTPLLSDDGDIILFTLFYYLFIYEKHKKEFIFLFILNIIYFNLFHCDWSHRPFPPPT